MHLIVVGAGIIGMTTAYYLARDGHRVTVVDRASGPGLETSFANGGQLSYSFVAPLAGPGVLPKVPGWLLDRTSPLRFKPRMDPGQWRWLAAFVAACNADRSARTTDALLALSYASRDLYHAMVDEGLPFDYAASGKLVMYRDAAAFETAWAQVSYQAQRGSEQRLLTSDECVALEPALAEVRRDIVGGIYTPSEDCGDCKALCDTLAQRLREAGVTFLFDTPVQSIAMHGGRAVGVRTAQGLIDADGVVVAAGVDATRLTGPLGIRPLLYGLKGYSLTYDLGAQHLAPHISVTDLQNKVVYARIGERLRVAGIVDIGDADLKVDPARIDALRLQTGSLFPTLADLPAQTWAGLRPATPTGVPIIGAATVPGLWLNIGHGALGFTLATGSGRLIADLIGNAERPALATHFALAA